MVTKPRRWKRGVLVVALVLLVAGGVWWWRYPKTLRLVSVTQLPVVQARYHQPAFARFDYILLPNVLLAPGFNQKNQEAACLTAMNWDGTLRWRIQLPPRNLWVRYATNWIEAGSVYGQLPVAVSPDGRCCAIGAQDYRAGLLIYTWRDGKLLGKVALNDGVEHGLPSLSVGNDGQVFCWNPTRPAEEVVLIAGGRILARGSFAIPASSRPAWDSSGHLSPDGRRLVRCEEGRFTCYAITRTGNRLQVTLLYSAQERSTSRLGHCMFFSMDDLLVSNSGAMYNDQGLQTPSTRYWQWIPSGSWGDVSTNTEPREWLMQIDHLPNQRVAWRMINPRTGASWQCTSVNSPTDMQCATADGRYAVIVQSSVREEIGNFLAKIPYLQGAARVLRKSGPSHAYYLAIYERPGRLRAWLPVTYVDGVPQYTDLSQGKTYEIFNIYPSADGHTLYLVCGEDTTHKPTLLTFSW
ncbi:MAG: hypothetical protein ACYDBB_18750 [Armatimonadota bacterium]